MEGEGTGAVCGSIKAFELTEISEFFSLNRWEPLETGVLSEGNQHTGLVSSCRNKGGNDTVGNQSESYCTIQSRSILLGETVT